MDREERIILNALYICNNNITKAAELLNLQRASMYRKLYSLRDRGIVNSDLRVKNTKECKDEYVKIAQRVVGRKRTEVKGDYIIIYNPLGSDMKLTHDQLYKSRGLDECDICWNDEDLIINIKRQYITTEEFNGMINENEQWYYWKLGVNDRNPYEGISLIDCIKS